MTEENGHVIRSKGHTPHPFLRVAIPAGILIASAIVAIILVKTQSKPKPSPPRERVATVDVQTLGKTREQVIVRTTGTVIPAQAISLMPQVSGPIVRLHPEFLPGGQVRAGETLVEIDPSDYELAVTNRWAGLVKAEYDWQVERGMQDVARHEWEAMQRLAGDRALSPLDRELALREPHLRLAQGNLASARALLTQAELSLARTRVVAPFNAVVRSRRVDVGSQVGTQTVLAELAGTDATWVNVTLPLAQAHWISTATGAGQPGSPATIASVPGLELQAPAKGHALRRLPDLDTAGRQAQFIVEVPHPAPADGPRSILPLGAYVRVEFQGPVLNDVFSVPRSALRDGSNVWLMNSDQRLEIRPVDVAWINDERVLIRTGLEAGERLVVGDISLPLKGMRLTAAGDRPPASGTPPENRTERPSQGPSQGPSDAKTNKESSGTASKGIRP